MIKNKEEVKEFLTTKMLEEISQLVSRYIVELSGNDDAKKTIEANDFIESMLTGKNINSLNLNMSFLEKNSERYQKILDYSSDIKALDIWKKYTALTVASLSNRDMQSILRTQPFVRRVMKKGLVA